MTRERHKATVARLKSGQRLTKQWNRRDGQPPRYEIALSMNEDGKTYRQIAQRMGITWESARSAVRYGKLRYRLPGGHA